MAPFDYSAEAELFFVRRKGSRRQPPGYKRFAQAALAVRFAIEEIRSELLRGTTLEVNEERFDCDGIRRLYESADYPLRRRKVPARSVDAEHPVATVCAMFRSLPVSTV